MRTLFSRSILALALAALGTTQNAFADPGSGIFENCQGFKSPTGTQVRVLCPSQAAQSNYSISWTFEGGYNDLRIVFKDSSGFNGQPNTWTEYWDGDNPGNNIESLVVTSRFWETEAAGPAHEEPF